MPSQRKRHSKILLPLSEEKLKAERKRLPIFKPHDLRSLVNEAQAGQPDADAGFVVALRRRNSDQMKDLLRCLGVDPSQPDAWARGFFLLTHYHDGVGHLARYPRRTNKNAAKWTTTHDLDLLREVFLLKERGLSERSAIKKLAADRKKRQLFPYRNQEGPHVKGTEQQRREDVLRARLQKLKAEEHGRDLYALIVGVNRDGLGFYQRILHDLDTTEPPQMVVKNQATSS